MARSLKKSLGMSVASYGVGYNAGKYMPESQKRGTTLKVPGGVVAGVALSNAYLSVTPAGQRPIVGHGQDAASSGIAMAIGWEQGRKKRQGAYYSRTVNGKVQRVKKGKRR